MNIELEWPFAGPKRASGAEGWTHFGWQWLACITYHKMRSGGHGVSPAQGTANELRRFTTFTGQLRSVSVENCSYLMAVERSTWPAVGDSTLQPSSVVLPRQWGWPHGSRALSYPAASSLLQLEWGERWQAAAVVGPSWLAQPWSRGSKGARVVRGVPWILCHYCSFWH